MWDSASLATLAVNDPASTLMETRQDFGDAKEGQALLDDFICRSSGC